MIAQSDRQIGTLNTAFERTYVKYTYLVPSPSGNTQQIVKDAAKKCLEEYPSDSVTFLLDAFSLLDASGKIDLFAKAIELSSHLLLADSPAEQPDSNDVRSQAKAPTKGASV